MPFKKLTKDDLEKPSLPEPGKNVAVTWDRIHGMRARDQGGLLGRFGIRVTRRGGVSFVVRYWNGSRTRWKTLGSYPRMKLGAARKKAAKYLRAAADGRDLVAEERATEEQEQASARRTVEALAAEWMAALPSRTTRRGRRISPAPSRCTPAR